MQYLSYYHNYNWNNNSNQLIFYTKNKKNSIPQHGDKFQNHLPKNLTPIFSSSILVLKNMFALLSSLPMIFNRQKIKFTELQLQDNMDQNWPKGLDSLAGWSTRALQSCRINILRRAAHWAQSNADGLYVRNDAQLSCESPTEFASSWVVYSFSLDLSHHPRKNFADHFKLYRKWEEKIILFFVIDHEKSFIFNCWVCSYRKEVKRNLINMLKKRSSLSQMHLTSFVL